jgi:hypothetical protein
MWANTDAVDDKVFADVGVFGVTTQDGGATWITKARPSDPALLRTGNYPSKGIWNSSNLASPIPDSALLVDMTIGRIASAPTGLFSEVERCLRSL